MTDASKISIAIVIAGLLISTAINNLAVTYREIHGKPISELIKEITGEDK